MPPDGAHSCNPYARAQVYSVLNPFFFFRDSSHFLLKENEDELCAFKTKGMKKTANPQFDDEFVLKIDDLTGPLKIGIELFGKGLKVCCIVLIDL